MSTLELLLECYRQQPIKVLTRRVIILNNSRIIQAFYPILILWLLSYTSTLGQVSITTPLSYAQNFNTLASAPNNTTISWADNSTLPGWFALLKEVNVSAPLASYRISAGNITNSLYSYGIADNSDRALGAKPNSAKSFYVGILFQNKTGATIHKVRIRYTGKQFYQEASPTAISVGYQIAESPITLNSGSFTTISSLSYAGITAASGGQVAAPYNATALDQTVSGLALVPDGYLMLQWAILSDLNSALGLGIDDVVVDFSAPVLETTPTSLSALNATCASPSPAQSYMLTGTDLVADVDITAPSGFELSQTDPSTGFANSLTIAQSGGTVNKTIYVRRQSGLAPGTTSNAISITHASSGAAPIPLPVSGSTSIAPLTVTVSPTIAMVDLNQPATFTASGATSYSWSNGESTTVITVSQGTPGTHLYSVTGTSGGCSAIASATLSVAAPCLLTPSATNLVASGPVGGSDCSVQLTAIATGSTFVFTGPGGYVFSNIYRTPGTYPAFANDVKLPGEYTLKVYNGPDCPVATYTVLVTGTACN